MIVIFISRIITFVADAAARPRGMILVRDNVRRFRSLSSEEGLLASSELLLFFSALTNEQTNKMQEKKKSGGGRLGYEG